MITSTKNPKIKEIKALQGRAKARRAAGAFVVEGVRLAEAAWAAGIRPQLVLYTEDLSNRGKILVGKMQTKKIATEAAAGHVMEAASDTQNPQGILLILPMTPNPQPKQLDFVLIADQVGDPGNLGTLMRSAAAAGVQAMWLTSGSVDAYAPKVVRGGMGAHFQLSIQTDTAEGIAAQAEKRGLQLLAAAAGEGQPYTEIDLTQPTALIVGGETEGINPKLMAQAQAVHIPMPGGGESLNAGAAGAVMLFEVVRQRKNK